MYCGYSVEKCQVLCYNWLVNEMKNTPVENLFLKGFCGLQNDHFFIGKSSKKLGREFNFH